MRRRPRLHRSMSQLRMFLSLFFTSSFPTVQWEDSQRLQGTLCMV